MNCTITAARDISCDTLVDREFFFKNTEILQVVLHSCNVRNVELKLNLTSLLICMSVTVWSYFVDIWLVIFKTCLLHGILFISFDVFSD